MAQGFKTMLHWNETIINYPYAITSVVYDPMALDINGDPFGQANAQVSLQCIKDGTRIQLPITQASLSLLPSPQQRALEKEIQLKAGVIEAKNALLAENREEIKELKSKLAMSQRTAEDWQKHSDKQVAEVRRLEKVCSSHWVEAQNYKSQANDAERKWTGTVGELDDTKNQLKEVRVANSQLLNANSCQASKIQALESQLNLLKHQYEGKCQAVRDLRTAGMSKERDEYSKALEQKDVQISQITKQAGEWKQTATTRAKEIERLAELVLQRTKERDALQAETGLCPCKPSKKLDPWGKEFWADYPLPLYSSGFHYAGTASQTPATVSLNTRLTAVEARVEKLEEAEGFPMESYNAPKWQHTMLYMGNQWITGFQGDSGRYYSIRTPEFNKQREWDLANQPTRWKPMSGAQKPDPMAGYYILDKSALVEEGDEYELSPGVWRPSGNWQCCNKSQGKAHRYRRKIK